MTKKQLQLLQKNNLTPQLLKHNELQSIKDDYINNVMFVCMVNLLALMMFAGLSYYQLFFWGLPIVAVITMYHSYISIHNYRIDIANYIEHTKAEEYKTLLKYFNRYSKKNQLQHFIDTSYMQWEVENRKTLADGSERLTLVSKNGLYHFTVTVNNSNIECMYNFY